MESTMKYLDLETMEQFIIDECPLTATTDANKMGMVVAKYTERVLHSFTFNGEEKVLFTSTAGRNKKSKAVYVAKAYADAHPELFRKYYKWVKKADTTDEELNQLIREYEVARDRADKLYSINNGKLIKSMSSENATKIANELKEAKNLETELKNKLQEIAVKELIDGNFTAARAKQANALRLRPGKLINLGFNAQNSAVVKDITVVMDTPDGKALDVTDFSEYDCKKYEAKTTDGLVLARHSLVKNVHELFDNEKTAYDEGHVERNDMMPSPRQIYSGGLKGLDKGLLVVFNDESQTLIGTDAFTGEKIDVSHKNIIFASVVKDYKSYASQEEYFNGRTYRVMEAHYEMKKISTSRQMMEMLYGASHEQLKKLAEKVYKQITAASTKEGYTEECCKMVDELRKEIYAPMANSRIFINSIAKKFWNLYTHALGGRFKTKGMTLFLTTSIDGIMNHLAGNDDWSIGENEILLPIDAMQDYKINDEVLLDRYPEMQAKPCILKVVGFHNIRGTAIIHPSKMIEKDADWDGDHGNIYGDKLIIEMAKATLDLFRACGGATYVFKDVEADPTVKVLDLEDNIMKTTDLGNVGSASTNMFVLAALIPIGATPDTVVYVSGLVSDENGEHEVQYALTVREIVCDMCLMKVAVTLEADSAKRGAASCFADTDLGKMLSAIKRKYMVYSEYFDHPYEVKLDFEHCKYMKKGEKPKDILGRKIANSILIELHDDIHEMLGIDKNKFLLKYTDVLKDYEYYDRDMNGVVVKKRTSGWTYVPSYKEYKGIDPAGWLDCDLYNELSILTNGKLSKPMSYGFRRESYFNDTMYYGGSSIGYKKMDELIAEFLGDITLRTDDMNDKEARKHFTFKTNSKEGGISFGLIARRMHACAKAASVDDENGGRWQSHKKRDEYVEKTAILACAMFSKFFGVELDDDLAKRFVVNEMRAYMFSANASESSAADLADMFTYCKDELETIRKANGLNY